jgi:DNA-binding CsgD family transcriptional regulator
MTCPSIENNPSITQTSDIIELCTPLFRNSDINYFCHCRIFEDKSYYALSSDPDWAKQFYYKEYGSAGYHGNPFRSGIYFSENIVNIGLTDDIFEDMVRNFGLNNPLFFVEIGIGYIDFFIYSIPNVNYNAINFYLNNTDVLRKFNLYFKESSKKIVSIASQKKIILPEKFHKTFQIKELASNFGERPGLKNIFHNFDPIISLNQLMDVTLTKQEKSCLNVILKGNTIKMAGKLLSISPRTVETHIERLKNKFNVNTKAELITLVMGHIFNSL